MVTDDLRRQTGGVIAVRSTSLYEQLADQPHSVIREHTPSSPYLNPCFVEPPRTLYAMSFG
jgi:hypothetical protein